MTALHFVGFKNPDFNKDPHFDAAQRVFGDPDFVHRRYDVRATQDMAPGDVVVFANGAEDFLHFNSFDDSDEDVRARSR